MLTEILETVRPLQVRDELTEDGTKYLVVETLFPPTGGATNHTGRFNLFNTDRFCVCAFEANTLEDLTKRLSKEKNYKFNISKRAYK